jgi:hypothetical protein
VVEGYVEKEGEGGKKPPQAVSVDQFIASLYAKGICHAEVPVCAMRRS